MSFHEVIVNSLKNVQDVEKNVGGGGWGGEFVVILKTINVYS
jgi:hypothetical protein